MGRRTQLSGGGGGCRVLRQASVGYGFADGDEAERVVG